MLHDNSDWDEVSDFGVTGVAPAGTQYDADLATSYDAELGMQRSHLENAGIPSEDIDQAQAMIADAAKMAYQVAINQGLSHDEARDAAISSAGTTSLHPGIAGDAGFIEAAVDKGLVEVANPMNVTAAEVDPAAGMSVEEQKAFLQNNEQTEMSGVAGLAAMAGAFLGGGEDGFLGSLLASMESIGMSSDQAKDAAPKVQQEKVNLAQAGLEDGPKMLDGTSVVAANTPGMDRVQERIV